MRYEFVKMEATGNDYVYFDYTEETRRPDFTPGELRLISDRRFGIGGDGVVVLGPSDRAAARMHMWNSDGSPSNMCGNALRSVALLVHNRTGEKEFLLESGSGLHHTRILGTDSKLHAHIEVEMGGPRFSPQEIPLRESETLGHVPGSPENGQQFLVNGGEFGTLECTVLSMGNPHCVIFVEDPETAPVAALGSLLEHHPAFPERTNVEFASLTGRGEINQRTHERGSGETLSCGSGACAVLIASVLTGRGPAKNRIHLRGGDLEVEWVLETGRVYLRGPAHITYSGQFDLEEMKRSFSYGES